MLENIPINKKGSLNIQNGFVRTSNFFGHSTDTNSSMMEGYLLGAKVFITPARKGIDMISFIQKQGSHVRSQ